MGRLFLLALLALAGQCQLPPRAPPRGRPTPLTTTVLGGVRRFREFLNTRRDLPGAPGTQGPQGSGFGPAEGPGNQEEPWRGRPPPLLQKAQGEDPPTSQGLRNDSGLRVVQPGSFYHPSIQVEAEELSEAEWEAYLQCEWEREGIVPFLLPAPPPFLANVDYGGLEFCLHLGNALTPAHTAHKPRALQFPGEAGHLHAVLLLDIDAPTGPYIQWLLLNVPADDQLKGMEAVEYQAPRPGPGTGQHRLVYLVYLQERDLPPNATGLPRARSCQFTGREGIDLTRLTRDLGLQGPLAANYFLSEWDITVEHTCKGT